MARTSAAGLASARRAATEWASKQASVQLHGLVLIHDAPGRLPQRLRDECKHLAGGVPRTWRVPYLPGLRLEMDPHQAPMPGAARRLIRSITTHLQKET